jgi:proteasome lid subunit RPN8/RPN11
MRASEAYEFQIIEWSNQKPYEEICGVLIRHRGTFSALQIPNVATNRGHAFAMAEKPFLAAINSGQVWGTWHVHPNPTDDDGPSLADMDRANAWDLPGCVLVRHNMQFRYYLPNDLPTPIQGRPYVPGIFDCYALMRDSLKKYLDFDHPDLDREMLDDRGSLPNHEQFWGPVGWEQLLQPKPGRLAMIDFGGHGKVNHLGLIVSRCEMLHHIRGQVSRLDFFGSWARWTHSYLAHPVLEQKVQENGWQQRLPIDPSEFEMTARANTPVAAPGGLIDAAGAATRVKIPGDGEDVPRRLPVRHPLRDIAPKRPKIGEFKRWSR